MPRYRRGLGLMPDHVSQTAAVILPIIDINTPEASALT